MRRGYGADLSLTHGSVVRVETINKKVSNAEIIYKWDKKDSHKLSLKSKPDEIYIKAYDIILSITGTNSAYIDIEVCVDWSSVLVFWKAKRLFAVQMGLFLGMLWSRAVEKGVDLRFIPPAWIRRFWGLAGNVPKLEIQETVLELYPMPESFKQYADEDDIDAYILALYAIFREKI